ncbi:MAG: DUF4317 domain-containing protein [Muribaculaceae bacterium]|nr:DUF4317 domain-containing protein [Muribaculaceae bacterium]MCM1479777.1 DUF4317 domain-containing protein [Muribaculaceae bacterium]
MNKKELTEIKRNFNENSGFFTLNRVATAYVDPEKNVLFTDNRLYPLIPEEEGTVLFESLRKVLGGRLGKNLTEYAFPENTREVDGAFHDVYGVIHSRLESEIETQNLVNRIVDNYEFCGAYAIIIGHCTYSITGCYEGDDIGKERADEYNFIVTAICPASTGDDGLIFDRDNISIVKKANTDLLISRAPVDGFLYPVFSDRQPDVNSVLCYTKNAKKPNISMVENVLDCDWVMSCQSEKEAFIKILYEVFGDDLSYSLVTQINGELNIIAANYEGVTELPRLTADGLVHILSEIGVDEERLKAVPAVWGENVPSGKGLTAANLAESKTEIKASDITVSLGVSSADKVRTSIRDGRRCLVIDLDDPGVIVNGAIVKM